jgi:biopolymer transport protein ExbB
MGIGIMTITNKLFEFIQQGGYIFMIPLILMSVISLAVILERIFALREKKIIPGDFEQRVKSFFKSERKDGFSDAKSLIDVIINKSLADLKDNGNNAIEKCFEINAELYIEHLNKRLWILSAIGNLAPLLGLLGTVVGLSIAFKQIGIEGLSQESVASGIAMALITTITGLFIAIPTLFALYGIKARGERYYKKIKILLSQFILNYQ